MELSLTMKREPPETPVPWIDKQFLIRVRVKVGSRELRYVCKELQLKLDIDSD